MYKLIASCLIVVLFSINGSAARKAPDFIQPCVGLKPDCLKKTVQELLPRFAIGLPELGMLPIDPLKEDYVFIKLLGGFKIELFNGTATGLRNCHIDSVKYEHDTQIADLIMHCNITIKGPYKANGKILIVAINGEGDAKIKLTNAELHARIRFEDKIRNGVTYYEVKDFNVTNTYGDKVTFDITNLFKGNALISDTVLAFLNENWKQIAEEFGKPIVDKFISLVYNIAKKFFEVVPKDELFVF